MNANAPIRIGRYDVLREIGAGGMGVVWLARDPTLDREAALKVLHHVSPEATTRLLREARSLARLSHPNVVQVFDTDLLAAEGASAERGNAGLRYSRGVTLEPERPRWPGAG